MVNLNLTALAVAATTFSIIDFQNHAAIPEPIPSANGRCPVVASASTSFQWVFVVTSTADVYKIHPATTSTLFLSYPGAGDGILYTAANVQPAGLNLNVPSVNPALNTVQLLASDFNEYALTSWPAVNGSNTSPLTWEVNTGRNEQIFTLVSS
ncbi:hypothetical protein MVEN_01298100 [Mycena venus]|uniref:Uncharacterized protein n=1 Tax=Mycena venus TaxID=2733690 RepID=A0A8H6Y102_9AGAR|nr:hypothetical protein MVEN_01298100 [Mycena venus]